MAPRDLSAGLLLALLTAWAPGVAAAPSPVEPPPPVSVASEGGEVLVSVSVEGVALGALLSEVARRVGFDLIEVLPVEKMVSAGFLRLPLREALDQLLSGVSFVLVYEPGASGEAGKLERVIVLGPRGEGAQVLAPAPSAEPSDGGDLVPPSEEPPRVGPVDAEAFSPDAPLERLLPLTAHHDARMRVVALEALTLHGGDDRARRVLMDGVLDPDPNIRSVAVGLLGPFVTEWPGAEEAVMIALRDPAASIRLLALQTMWEASSPRVSAALDIALGDKDPGVRALARELLESISPDDSKG